MTQYPKILSIDIGNHCGWAYAENNRIIAWGTADFSQAPGDPYSPGNRAISFYNWLTDWKGIDELYYEMVGGFQSSQASLQVYYSMWTQIQMFSSATRTPLRYLFTSSLKKEFLGYGGKLATKTKMCEMAHRLGWNGGAIGTERDHNAADAIALIVCLQKKQGNEITF